MDRRFFGKLGLLGLSAGVVQSCVSTNVINNNYYTTENRNLPMIKPPLLKKGDTIGLIAPASTFGMDAYEMSISQISSLGFNVKTGENILKKYGNFAGTDAERVADIHAMFEDKEVKAIWCLRGGYGVTKILPLIDFELIKNNPKLLIGYSDITALLHSIQLKTGLVGIHGPVGKSPFNEFTKSSIEQLLFHSTSGYIITESNDIPDDDAYRSEVIAEGNMEGKLSGGNLSLLAALSGTPFHWDATDKLAFIEDIDERPYRVDRMLTQLLQSSNLDKAKGILLGIFENCEKKPDEKTLGLKEVLRDRLGDLGIPVYYGFTYGHIDNICSLPIGLNAYFNTEQKRLTIKESIFDI